MRKPVALAARSITMKIRMQVAVIRTLATHINMEKTERSTHTFLALKLNSGLSR
jgi:hypothetical protein